MVLAALAGAAAVAAAPEAAVSRLDRFVLRGWRLENSIEGDLGGDPQPDIVLVLRQDDPAKRLHNDGLGAELIDSNPRRLVLLLREGKALRPAARSDTILPPAGDPDNACLADPLEEGGLAIRKRSLRIDLQDWLSCGSYGVTNRTYTFRLENGRLRLIGFDRLDFSRASGEGEKLSANYLTGRYSKTTGLAIAGEGPGRPATIWKSFPAPPVYADGLSRGECLAIETKAGFC